MITKNFIAAAVFCLSLFLLTGNTYSQTDKPQTERIKKTPEEIATKKADKMRTNLSLTDDQYKQVYSLILGNVQEKKSNKEKYQNLDKETRRKMKSENRKNFKKQLSGILNQEQLTKYNEMKGKHKNKDKSKKKLK